MNSNNSNFTNYFHKIENVKIVEPVKSGLDLIKYCDLPKEVTSELEWATDEVAKATSYAVAVEYCILSICASMRNIFILDFLSGIIADKVLKLKARQVLMQYAGMTIEEFNNYRALERSMVGSGFLKEAPMNIGALNPAILLNAQWKEKIRIDTIRDLHQNLRYLEEQFNQAIAAFKEEQQYFEEAILPEDELPPVKKNDDEPDFSNALENDGSFHYSPLQEEEKETELVQILPNKEKLVKIKLRSGIKYVIVGEDVDVARLPTIYKLVREQLRMGRNITTDRLTRVLKLEDILDLGFTRKEAAQLMEIPEHIVRSDSYILREIKNLNRDM